jgi:hypothetical protein
VKLNRGGLALKRFLILITAAVFIAALAADAVPSLPSFEQWQAACAKPPSNRSLRGRLPSKDLLPLRSFAEFDAVLEMFFGQCKTGALSSERNWIGGFPANSFFDTGRSYFASAPGSKDGVHFAPFCEKVTVPNGSEVFFHADFHGDVRSLVEDLSWLNSHGYLKGYSIPRTNFYMIFLGDYTDRGAYGIEVLYTLLRLKTANPNQVFLNRGNHEDVAIQSRYGFLYEGRAKYGTDFDAAKVMRAYDFFPVVTYLGNGSDFIQCNHGGMEPGFSPGKLLEAEGPLRFELLGTLRQQDFLANHPEWLAKASESSRDLAREALKNFTPDDPISPSLLGFMWNDFSVLNTDPDLAFDPGRGFVYGERATGFLLKAAGTEARKVAAVFRGHQQSPSLNPLMRRIVASHGVFRHWQTTDSADLLNAPIEELASHIETGKFRAIPPGSVWTFNVAPDSVYGAGCGFTFDTFGLLKTAPAFQDWRLEVVNVDVPI